MVYIYSSFIVVAMISEISSWILNDVDLPLNIYEGLGDLRDEFEGIVPKSIGLVFPGTKWCGPGSIAASDDDLGPARETDACCRDHDKCPDIIKPGETKYGLTNIWFHTRLNCTCDYKFYDCLHQVNSKTSTIVGRMYFDTITAKCFWEDYPVTGCKEKGGLFDSKCVEYEYDTSGDKIHQWFDLPPY